MKPFDFINDINYDKRHIMDKENEKDYLPFITNRMLGYFQDTVLLANVMNQYHFLDKPLQFSFLINTVRKRKRFTKAIKADEISDIDVIKEYYGYSNEKARQVFSLFDSEQLTILREKVNKGGRK